MKLFLIIIVLAFIVFAVSIYLGWHFTKAISEANKAKYMNGLYYEDEEDYWF